MEAELFHADYETDMIQANSHFFQLCKHTQNGDYAILKAV